MCEAGGLAVGLAVGNEQYGESGAPEHLIGHAAPLRTRESPAVSRSHRDHVAAEVERGAQDLLHGLPVVDVSLRCHSMRVELFDVTRQEAFVRGPNVLRRVRPTRSVPASPLPACFAWWCSG